MNLERIIVPGYELDRPLPAQYAENETTEVKKSRYKVEQEKNQADSQKRGSKS